MLYKTIVFLFFMMPLFSVAQTSSEWSLFLNETKLLSGSVDSAASIQLSKQSKGNLQIAFEKKDTSFTRTILLMNKTRQILKQKQMNTSCKKVSFSVADILIQSSAKPFSIYIVDVPANSAKAMGIRVAPVAICNVGWKE